MKTNTLDFDAQALRERILDLAMRGKLVPQDPNDEPASVLLEKIKAEKEELVKEKKIKKTKALPEITDDEKPFDIPDSWEWVRLGEVAKTVTKGTTPRGGKNAYIDNGIKFYRGENIKNYSITSEPIKFISNEINVGQLRRSQLVLNDLLITIAGTLGNVAVVKENNLPANVNQAIAIVRLINSSSFDEKYLSFALGNQSKEIIKRKKTTSIPNLTLQQISEAVIPLPPLSEQSRIAAKIAQLFALLRKVESSTQQYAELQTLLKTKVLDLAIRGKLVKQDPNDEPTSVLLEKIKAEKAELVKEKKIKKSKPLPPITDEEKPFDIPDSWEWVRLGDISKDIRYGYTASAKENGNSKFIRITDIQNGRVNWNTVPFCSVPDSKIQALQLLKDDMLIARTGGTVGKSYKIENIPTTSVFASYLIRIRFFLVGKEDYTKYVMQSPLYWSFISKKQSGTGQPNVNATKLSKFIFPLPPLSEQNRIAVKIAQLFALL